MAGNVFKKVPVLDFLHFQQTDSAQKTKVDLNSNKDLNMALHKAEEPELEPNWSSTFEVISCGHLFIPDF